MLSVRLICVGKLGEKFWADAVKEYTKRLGAYCKLEIIELPEQRLPQTPSEGEIAQALHLGLADRHALGLPGDARVAGSTVDLFDLRRARQRIDNGVFAAAGTYYQNFHTVKIERLKVKS